MFDKVFIEKINTTLKQGGVIAFVTDTVWGVGCLPDNESGVNKIYEIKNRDRSKPLILMSNDKKYLMPYVKNLSELENKLIEKYFPGALTLVTEKSEKTPDFVTSNLNTIGIRVPNNETFQELLNIIEGHVLATTSANKSNQPSAKTYEDALNKIGDFVDIVIPDFENKCKGLESTVATVNGNDIKILRQGSLNIK